VKTRKIHQGDKLVDVNICQSLNIQNFKEFLGLLLIIIWKLFQDHIDEDLASPQAYVEETK
jgi:hypothetical protein